MRTRTMVLVIALAAVVTTGVFAADELRGRDVARDGRLATVTGTLLYDQDEWFLDARGQTWELHMGPLGHDEALPFTDGVQATVRGFVLAEHIAPLWVTIGEQTFDFWHEARYPRWAGEGARMNAADEEQAEYGARRFAPADPEAAPGADELVSPHGRGTGEFEPLFRNQIARPGRGRW